jgi:HEAT repeat protein/beta-lactamase regulating signal transducer with metallopeptidase domain
MIPASVAASAILTMLAKGLAVLALAALAAIVLRRRSAATRYVAWAIGMTGLLALPLLSPLVPAWHIALPSIAVAAPAAILESSASPEPAAAEPLVKPAALWPAPTRKHQTLALSPNPAAPAASSVLSPLNLPWPILLTALWIAGSFIAVLRLAVGLVRVHGVRRRAAALSISEWRDDLETCSAQLGLARDVDLLTSDEVQVPMTCGWRRPAVLVPTVALTWSDERRRVVLLHELAHVRRGDFAAHIAASIALALHWLNPLTWVAIKRMRTEREGACDDLVLACGAGAPDYAEHLLDIARTVTIRPAPAVALAMARRSELEGRLLAILDGARARNSVRPVAVAGAGLALSLVILPIAALQLGTPAEAFPLVVADELQATTPPPTPSPTPKAAPTPTPTPPPTPTHKGKATPAVAGNSISDGGPTTGVRGGVPGGIEGSVKGGIGGGVGAGAGAGVGSGVSGPTTRRSDQDASASGAAHAPLDDATRTRIAQSLATALQDSDPDVRQQALHALSNMGSTAAVPAIITALKDSNADVRQSAAHALGSLDDKRAVTPLIEALRDANADVRQQAAWSLGQLGSRDASTALGAALSDASADVREQVAWALGQLRDPATTRALSAALKDANASVREQVAHALGEIGGTTALPALAEALKDAVPDVRAQAAYALGQIASPQVVEQLSAALKDANAEVRQQVIHALSEIMDADGERREAERDRARERADRDAHEKARAQEQQKEQPPQ